MKSKLLNTLYCIFLASILYLFVKQILHRDYLLSFGISDFLINYKGGFVRRGLFGEVLFYIVKYTGFNVIWIIKFVCVVCFIYLVFFFVKKFLSKGYSLYILPLCFFLGAPILSGLLFRKDSWMICSFIIIVKSFLYFRKKTLFLNILFINLLLILVVLSHEIFALFSLPILFLLFCNLYKNQGKTSIYSAILSLLSLFPILTVFLLVTLFHSDPHAPQLIWDSWCTLLNIDFSDVGNDNAIGAIAWSTSWTLRHHLALNFFRSDGGIFAVLYWPIVLSVIYYISMNCLFVLKKSDNCFTFKDRTILSCIIIIQFVCLIPAFAFLSCDYIRLFFYWISSSFAIFLLIPSSVLQTLFFSKYYDLITEMNSRINTFVYPTKALMVFLMLFIAISPVSFLIKYMYSTSMIYQILYLMSKPFFFLKMIYHTY